VTGPDLLEVDAAGVQQEALWRAQADQRRVEWGSPGSGEYSAWLQVNASGDEPASEVVLHVSFLGDQPAAHGGRAASEVQRDLDTALERLAALVTGEDVPTAPAGADDRPADPEEPMDSA
jgi:hypothetical protein